MLFQVILSAGTLNSPQILLLSGIGPKDTLDKYNIPTIEDLPGVGQNLQNHVGVKVDFKLTKELNLQELTWATAMDYMLQRQGPLSGTGMSQVGNHSRNDKIHRVCCVLFYCNFDYED